MTLNLTVSLSNQIPTTTVQKPLEINNDKKFYNYLRFELKKLQTKTK